MASKVRGRGGGVGGRAYSVGRATFRQEVMGSMPPSNWSGRCLYNVTKEPWSSRSAPIVATRKNVKTSDLGPVRAIHVRCTLVANDGREETTI